MRRRSAVLAATGVGAFAALTTAVGAASGAPPEFLVADAATGLSFVVAGLAAAWLRPRSPAGPLLLLSGALWFVGSYAPTGRPVVTHLGFAFEAYYDLTLAILLLLLAAPGERPRPRWLLPALAAAMAARSAGRLLLQDPVVFLPDCTDCPPNPFAVRPDLTLFVASEVVTNVAMAALFIVVAIVALRRLAGAGPLGRRARWPVLVAGTLAMAGAAYDALDYAWSTATETPLLELPDPAGTLFPWLVFGLRTLVPIGFLAGALRVRGDAGPLAPLAARLGAPGASSGVAGVGDALRRALGDPSLEVFRPGAAGSWTGESGNAVEALPAGAGRVVTMVGTPTAPVAALVHDRALEEHPELLDGVVAILRLTLENERLRAELQAQLDEVTASRQRLVTAAEEERRRIERDLHDGAQQRLVAATLSLQQARATSGDAPPSVLRARLDALADDLAQATQELRELARGIHPAILATDGLGAAIAGLARRAAVPTEVRVEVPGRLPDVIESTVYFTVAEALTNVQRYARASQASVDVTRVDHLLDVAVVDDGVGGADPGRGSGLRGLADRVTALGGELRVDSPEGGGTAVRARIPVP